jgi:hypothetical protein
LQANPFEVLFKIFGELVTCVHSEQVLKRLAPPKPKFHPPPMQTFRANMGRWHTWESFARRSASSRGIPFETTDSALRDAKSGLLVLEDLLSARDMSFEEVELRLRAVGAAWGWLRELAESYAGGGTSPNLDDEDERILRALAKRSPQLQTLDAIEADSRVSRRTISVRIKALLKVGLVSRPRGPKSGTTITQAGLHALKRIDSAKLAR